MIESYTGNAISTCPKAYDTGVSAYLVILAASGDGPIMLSSQDKKLKSTGPSKPERV